MSYSQQAAHDTDRVEILREELRKLEAALESLSRRRAERLAASDALGVTQAEEQQERTAGDIAALKRELAVASRAAAPATAVALEPKLRASPRTSPAKGATSAPWWDVYGKGRRPEPAAPGSVAPLQDAPAHPVPARRLE